MCGMHRRRAGRLALVLAFGGFLLGPAALVRAGQADMVLPDVVMLSPTEFRIQISSTGRRLLRFTTVAANIGPGPFQLYGYDADGAKIGDTLSVRQQIKLADGTWMSRNTGTTMTYSGDGHNHWHLNGYQRFWIQKLDGTVLKYLKKIGFCAFDSYYYGSKKAAFYTAARSVCQVNANKTVLMGTSRMWGDVYRSTIAHQWIDITGIPNGDYLVNFIADPPLSTGGSFLESNEKNNRAWAKIRIGSSSVTVLSKSPNP